MKGKILFATGLAVGYVLGTRAGRERYDEIKAVVGRIWGDPRVQKQVHNAEGFVSDNAKKVVSNVAEKVTGSKTTAAKPATTATRSRSARSTAAKPSTSK
jgi:hypothetical protein